MSKRYNLARMSTATTGAGTITLGSAVTSYLSFADAGVSDGETVTYAIEDGNNREIGRGVYTASGTTLTRNVLKSTNSDAAINLSGSAQVFITFAAEDISTLSLSDGSASTPSLTNEGDANTGIWFPAADSIALGTGGSEAVRIDSSQNVGIGVTSPTVALDVAGAINNTGNVTVGGALTTVGNVTVGGALDVTDAATTRTNLGLVIGTDVMAYDAELQAIAGLTPTDGGFVVGNGTTFVVESGATARTSLGLAIGTDVQAYDSNLTAIGNALDFEAANPTITFATGDSFAFTTSTNTFGWNIGSVQSANLSTTTFNIAQGLSTSTAIFQIGSGRTGDGISLIDLIGDATYTDYGLRLIRNGGANGISTLQHRGTGALQIFTQDSAPISFATNNSVVGQFTAAGDLLLIKGMYSSTLVDDGVKSTGTYTPTPVGGNYKTIQNNGAFTLAPPSASGYYTIFVDMVQQGSAGTMTTSGFDDVSGDSITTTSGNEYTLIIRKTGYQTTLQVIANASNS